MKLIVLSCLLAATLLAPAGGAVRIRHERHPDLRAALKSLEKSRSDLMKGDRDYGGHRTKAVQAIDAAIDEIKQAIEFDRRKG